jgi:hypothetical protein
MTFNVAPGLIAGAVVAICAFSLPTVMHAAPEPPVSRIPIVFKTSWPDLVALADAAIPNARANRPSAKVPTPQTILCATRTIGS